MGSANPYAKRLIENEKIESKAKISSEARQRLDAYKMLLKHADDFKDAYETIRFDPRRDSVSSEGLATVLNEAGSKPAIGKKWTRSSVERVQSADGKAIHHAVLECRTRITYLALEAGEKRSADFGAQSLTDIENEYIEVIAEILAAGSIVRGERRKGEIELKADARQIAINVARNQRACKPISMMARERLWDRFEPFPRKIFEERSNER